MKKALCHLESRSPYSQGRYHQTEKKNKESHEDYEQRTWREKCHYEKNGEIYIPPMQFCNSLKEASKYLNIQIPGKGKSTYTKNFESGIMVTDKIFLNVTVNKVESETFFVPSDGRRGGSTRVLKTFPLIREWKAVVTYFILDDIITEDVFKKVLETSGQLIGIGRFRPRNWGY